MGSLIADITAAVKNGAKKQTDILLLCKIQ